MSGWFPTPAEWRVIYAWISGRRCRLARARREYNETRRLLKSYGFKIGWLSFNEIIRRLELQP